MAVPWSGAYRWTHDHRGPAARGDRKRVPPRPVVAARVEPGSLPGRRNPGTARRAAHPVGLGPLERAVVVLVVVSMAGVVDGTRGHVPADARAHQGPPPSAASYRGDRDTAAAAGAGLADRRRHRRPGPLAGNLAAGRLPLPGRSRAG